MLQMKEVTVGAIGTCCYILWDDARTDCVVIDPGDEPERIRKAADGRTIAAILLTHGHFDHIGAVRALMTPETELVVHAQDAPMLFNPQENASLLMGAPVTAPEATKLVHEGDTVMAAGLTFTVLHTPGHTAGSVCYQIGDKLFTGDTLFRFGCGRTDLPTGSSEQMQASLARVVPMARIWKFTPDMETKMSNEIQQGLQDDLTTIEPDLMNMTRLFSLPDSVWDAPEYHFAAAIEGGQYVIRFYGKTQAAQGVTDIPSDADARIQALHRRRALRRLCRQTLYDLLRKETGIHPPWGSMTGIRPTHLMYEALNEGMSMADAQEHLVHQFDVAPEKAALLAELVSVQQQLPPPGDDWMDVYIGIPFCTTRCTYCSFSSGELGDGHLVAPYLTALFREMDACAQLLRDAGKKLRAVYVGGGTPTSLNEEQLPRLLEKMMQCFPCAMEYTVEAGRPDTLTLPKLEAIRRAGVQRISINPQTMNDKTLRVIGRAHTAQQVEEAYAMARTANIHHINMDVIAGLPGENIDDFARTMDAALRLKPESLTVHTLAIKRSSRLHLENAPLPDGETASRMVQLGLDTAHQLGMKPYYLYRQKYMAGNQENVGYALPGHACQYNVDIMEETTHILALGAGGISKRVYPEEGHIGRAPNVSNIEQYIARVEEMIGRKRALFLPEMPL